MPLFHYKAKDASGDLSEGTVAAGNKFELARNLKAEGKEVLFAEETQASGKNFSDAVAAFLTRIKMEDLIMFSKNLSAMINAGLALSRALSVLERQTPNQKFKGVLHELGEDISKGTSLSDAMGKHSAVFSTLFVSMVRAGEESGNLAQSLEVIGSQLEKSYVLRKKIKGAMMYPAVVITAMIIIATLMFIYVVPSLLETFKSMNVELPTSTKVIIFISDSLQNYGLWVFLGAVVLAIGVVMGLRTSRGKRAFEWVVLHLPVISGIAKESNSAMTSRTLSSLLSSGVDIIEALHITRDVVQNSYYKDVIDAAIKNIEKGSALSVAFVEAEKIYPILVGEMIEVGEETGKLSEMLLRVAVFYEAEVEAATKDMATIIEPILMLVIGGGVGFFAVSMITPLYSVMNNI
ncbi:MAG: hypothetical protein A2675_01775 [Candidatus Yonathbacteria bacterium RIFCSPHIGHO2_01_FULL_51_10]|uniref:Type II secretion system protein GspF domain-containing protein n=1 Tax=Candidatus Yonathbacteria bacterium RIFCSPHIGHO2_01_FULL_51_10 TaxID=1802723 RepID=A0A1G2S9Y7_9BACT|nr:MAG: hypothetical protein A2675_01775 [Candidatus Yonathbacteria bacterium RIFCSPHIGHO2_01_FULL_51_10]